MAKDILGQHNLRNTRSRTDVLEVFIQRKLALSQPDIESAINGDCDRVTIYRTLTTFLEKGILHKVLDGSGAMKYALCSSFCQSQAYHHHDHIHFKCTQCGATICIDDVHVPAITLPAGFTSKEINVLMEGTCPKCN